MRPQDDDGRLISIGKLRNSVIRIAFQKSGNGFNRTHSKKKCFLRQETLQVVSLLAQFSVADLNFQGRL